MTNSDRHIVELARDLVQEISRLARLTSDKKMPTSELLKRIDLILRMTRRLPLSPTEERRIELLLGRLRHSRSKAEIRDVLGESDYIIRNARHRIEVTPVIELSRKEGNLELEERLSELETLVRESNKTRPESEQIEEIKEVTLESLEDKDILFGIMPFGVEFDDVWDGAIRKAAGSSGLYPLRIDMLTKSSNITEDIIEAIKMSKVVVVDVTKSNPNVMFEFGYALALKKAPIIISQSIDELPFDIQYIRTIAYRNSWKGIEKLHDELHKFIKSSYKPKQKKGN